MNEVLESILLKVSKSPLIDTGELTQAYHLVIKSLHEGLKIARAGIWFVKADYSEISCQLLIDTYHKTEIEALTLSAEQFPRYFSALKSERAILADDAHTHPATSEFSQDYLTPLNISSMLDVPIRHKGEMIGIICCEQIGPPKCWTKDEASFAGSMADLIGRAINANAYQAIANELKLTNDRLEVTINERTKQLVESEKMAALGNTVAGVAHEVNTPLGISITTSSAVSDLVNELSTTMEEGQLTERKFKQFISESKEYLIILNSNLKRSADLIANFKQMSIAHSDNNFQHFNLKDVIEHLLVSLHPETKKSAVEIHLEMSNDLTLYSYSSHWTQIISNLILNSCRHAFTTTDHPQIHIKISKKKKSLIIQYKDNGCGIEKENIKRVIEPFYTTKRGRGGTGLGMSIVYNLVCEHLKGKLDIRSNFGEGVTINIECPLIIDEKYIDQFIEKNKTN